MLNCLSHLGTFVVVIFLIFFFFKEIGCLFERGEEKQMVEMFSDSG